MNETDTRQDEQPSKIDRLMEQHDLDREEAEAIVGELQEGSDPIICERCGRPADLDEGRAVATVTLPDGSTAAMDNECYAEIIDEKTTLSTKESQVVAATIAGLSYPEIQEKYEVSDSNIPGKKNRARDKGADAVDQIEKAYATIEIVEALEEAER